MIESYTVYTLLGHAWFPALLFPFSLLIPFELQIIGFELQIILGSKIKPDIS